MNEEYFDFFDERVSVLEKNVEILTDWLNEISPEIRELTQKTKEDCSGFTRCKFLFSFYIVIIIDYLCRQNHQ